MTSRERESSTNREARKWLPIAGLILVVALIGVGGGWALARQRGGGAETTRIELAPSSVLSAKVKTAPPVVQEAYRFAIANPEVLSNIPCYCGCGGMGHTSDLDCFIEEFKPDGSVVFGYHAFG